MASRKTISYLLHQNVSDLYVDNEKVSEIKSVKLDSLAFESSRNQSVEKIEKQVFE